MGTVGSQSSSSYSDPYIDGRIEMVRGYGLTFLNISGLRQVADRQTRQRCSHGLQEQNQKQ